MNAYLILSALMLCSMVGLGQDVMYKVDGEQLEVKVLEVTPSDVKYKLKANLDGPDYVLPKSDIYMLEYANGMKEVFGVEKKEEPANLKQSKTNLLTTEDEKLYRRQRAWGLTGAIVGGAGAIVSLSFTISETAKYLNPDNIGRRSVSGPIASGFFTAVSLSVLIAGSNALVKSVVTKSRISTNTNVLRVSPMIFDYQSFSNNRVSVGQAYGMTLSYSF